MSGLAMSNDEIVVRYKQAKNKGEQVKILAELNNCPVERIIGILTANGVDNRNFNKLRSKLKKKEQTIMKEAVEAVKGFDAALNKGQQIEEQSKIPYKKPEIIPEPPKPESIADKQLTVSDAVAVIKAELADINRQQYLLDMRKADLYKQVWDMMGEM